MKIMHKVLIGLILILIVIMTSSNSFAGITPGDLTGEGQHGEIDLTFIDDITEFVSTIGKFIAVGVMMIIGIRYVTGSIEEKANYKKSMVPYIVGCFILFGAATLAPQIKDLFSDVGTETTDIANLILGIIQSVGSIVTVAVLMLLGLKYMTGSIEERASYKKSMIPYLVGVILIFAAVNLTAMIYDISTQSVSDSSTDSPTQYERDEDGNPICRNCGNELGVAEQRRGNCANCGEPTGI